ncbi:hypothetical protein Tco_1378363 [Tanacetum coccineum]
MFSIIYEPVHGIIYKNSKKEKRVMRHSEIHKFCDATLNKDQPSEPKSLVPLDPATQVEFNLDEITFKSNNEVALLYPKHPNKEHFMIVPDFISKCCLSEAFTRSPNQYKEYLSGFWYTTKVLKNSKVWFSTPTGGILGEVGVTTFRIAIEANYLSYLSEYAKLPSIETIREWFPAIGYSGEIEAKGTLKKGLLPLRWRLLMVQIIQCLGVNLGRDHQLAKKTRQKVVPYPRFLSLLLEHKMEGYGNDDVTLNPTQIFSVLNWALKKNQHEGPHFTTHILAICNAAEPVAFKAPKTSSKDEKVIRWWRYPIQLKSDSLPHAHAQTIKTYYKHQDSRIKKAQVLKTKTSTNSNIKDNFSETKLRGRLLESFQDDAKYEHVGQDTRSQGGKDDQD